jgi:hypothetical protein
LVRRFDVNFSKSLPYLMQLAGVEPATFGSVDRRSIQLS